MRDKEVGKAAQVAYYESRRPRRPKIVSVPAANSTPEQQTTRPVVVPFTPRPIAWKEARAIGRAKGRVLEGLPAWPKGEEAEQLKQALARSGMLRQVLTKARAEGKIPEKVRRDPRGSWWLEKLADVVDRRKTMTMPAYAPRAGRRTRDKRLVP